MALVAETAADARDVMVEGQSGILAISPKDERPIYESSKRRLTWPNGATATLYNGTEPDQLRGPEHDTAWVDEIAKYRHAQDTWDNLQFGLRLGERPRACITTTPRPIPIIRDMIKDPGVAVTRGSTFDNRSNLPDRFIRSITKKYAGTRVGRQELEAELLDDVIGGLWSRDMVKLVRADEIPALQRVVVAVDPSGTDGDEDAPNNSVGIIGAGHGVDDQFYVIQDSTCSLSPSGWARMVNQTFNSLSADLVVAEKNFGGAMVESVLRATNDKLPISMVNASRGKVVRAQPIAALYEQGRVFHGPGLELLEDQMMQMTHAGYVGEGSPDRVDALVWALSELALGEPPPSVGMILRGRRR